MAYRHEGFWRSMDTLKDRQVLEDMVEQGKMPWRAADAGKRRQDAVDRRPMIALQLARPGAGAVGPVPRRPFRRHRDRRRRHAARLDRAGVRLEVHWCVLSAPGPRAAEAKASAAAFLPGAASTRIELGEFEDGLFPYQGREIKAWLEDVRTRVDPDVVLTHRRDDAHQDHREICQLTWNLFRDHLILEYEIPKWDGDLGRPNVYMPLTAAVLERKIELLHAHFGTQRSKQWFDAGDLPRAGAPARHGMPRAGALRRGLRRAQSQARVAAPGGRPAAGRAPAFLARRLARRRTMIANDARDEEPSGSPRRGPRRPRLRAVGGGRRQRRSDARAEPPGDRGALAQGHAVPFRARDLPPADHLSEARADGSSARTA